MRLLLVGDTHGNTAWLDRVTGYAVKEGCDRILQLGDFGFWSHTGDGVKFLDNVAKFLGRRRLQLYWIDGNHENHALLRAHYDPHATACFWPIRERLWYIPRGARWTWAGLKFLGVGGASSVDKDPDPRMGWTGRIEGKSWWPEETLTDDEVTLASTGGPVDIVVSHDCPAGVDLPCLRTFAGRDYPESTANRERLRRVVDAVTPRLLVHGHYHDRYTSRLVLDDEHTVSIEGLSCDNRPGSYAVIDLAEFT